MHIILFRFDVAIWRSVCRSVGPVVILFKDWRTPHQGPLPCKADRVRRFAVVKVIFERKQIANLPEPTRLDV